MRISDWSSDVCSSDLLLALMGLAMLGCAAPAAAATLHINRSLCHAVSGIEASDASLAERRFYCTDPPVGYQHRSPWLRDDPRRSPDARSGRDRTIPHQPAAKGCREGMGG